MPLPKQQPQIDDSPPNRRSVGCSTPYPVGLQYVVWIDDSCDLLPTLLAA